MFLRMYSTALDPSDLPEVRRIFAEDIKPVFEGISGCRAMELLVANEKNPGGLVDGATISRWDSHAALTEAFESRAVAESMVRILPFLQLEPVVKIYEIVE